MISDQWIGCGRLQGTIWLLIWACTQYLTWRLVTLVSDTDTGGAAVSGAYYNYKVWPLARSGEERGEGRGARVWAHERRFCISSHGHAWTYHPELGSFKIIADTWTQESEKCRSITRAHALTRPLLKFSKNNEKSARARKSKANFVACLVKF